VRASLPYVIAAVTGLAASPVPLPGTARAQSPSVRAVLFFSPTCPHCHQVINEDLPVIFERFGGKPRVWTDQNTGAAGPVFYYVTNGRLEILLVDASQPEGGALYDVASTQFAVPRDRMGVPRLVVGDSVLVGSLEIPARFPGMIERAEAAGGLDWPPIPGLVEHVPAIPDSAAAPPADSAAALQPPEPAPLRQEQQASRPTPAPPRAPDTTAAAEDAATADTTRAPAAEVVPAPSESAAVPSSLESISGGRATAWERFGRDPTGNSMAVAVLLIMLASLFVVSSRAASWDARERAAAAVPVLAVVGAAVAAYLAYVELRGVSAVCGPVGDCNAVQQSPYAQIAGIPIGVLGLAGYAAIVLAWMAGRFGGPRIGRWATLALFAMAFAGVIFSFYLTLLEPFVIGATCMWCLSSAVIMMLIFLLAAGPGTRAWHGLRRA